MGDSGRICGVTEVHAALEDLETSTLFIVVIALFEDLYEDTLLSDSQCAS